MLASCSALNIHGTLWAVCPSGTSIIQPGMTLIHSFIHSLRSWVREERNPSPSVPVTSSSTGLEYRLWEMGADKCLTRARPACPYRQPKISLIKSSIPPGSDITSCRFSGVNSKPLEERDFPNTGPCPLTFHAADDY